MSNFTHLLCERCYSQAQPGRIPTRVINDPPNLCCRCGFITNGGIYYRENPNVLACMGMSGIHRESGKPEPITEES